MKNTNYVSEIDQFLGSFLLDQETKAKQQHLRATWWDKSPEEIEQHRLLEKSDEKHEGYVYFSYPHKNDR